MMLFVTQSASQLNAEGADAFAELLRMFRGAGAEGTTPEECRAMTPAVLLDIHKVCREQRQVLSALHTAVALSLSRTGRRSFMTSAMLLHMISSWCWLHLRLPHIMRGSASAWI